MQERYAQKLEDAGLKETALGAQWFAASELALTNPVTISIPHQEAGYFAAEKPRAAGLLFKAKRGEKLRVQLEKQSTARFTIYADLWKAEDHTKPELLYSLDTSKNTFDFEIDEAGTYLLRLQPELLSSGAYTLSIAVGPSLGFPRSGWQWKNRKHLGR